MCCEISDTILRSVTSPTRIYPFPRLLGCLATRTSAHSPMRSSAGPEEHPLQLAKDCGHDHGTRRRPMPTEQRLWRRIEDPPISIYGGFGGVADGLSAGPFVKNKQILDLDSKRRRLLHNDIGDVSNGQERNQTCCVIQSKLLKPILLERRFAWVAEGGCGLCNSAQRTMAALCHCHLGAELAGFQ
jgi:hypothetical protein